MCVFPALKLRRRMRAAWWMWLNQNSSAQTYNLVLCIALTQHCISWLFVAWTYCLAACARYTSGRCTVRPPWRQHISAHRAHCEGKAADLYDLCVTPEKPTPPPPSQHICDSESNYLPLTNLLISHTFPIMVMTFPAFHKERSILQPARSNRTTAEHIPISLLLCRIMLLTWKWCLHCERV